MASPGRPVVHVVVVSYRTPRLLERCLASLRPEVDAGRATVTVVDNASGDGSAELARGLGFAVREPGANLGFGAAVLLGARDAAPAAWIAPANADVALEPGALDALLDAAERDPRAGILAPRLLTPDGAVQHSVHPFPSVRFAAAFALGVVERSPRLRRQQVLEGHWDADAGRRVPWAHGALLLVRREAWDRIGGFDPAMWMYAEDLDLCWRAARAGWATRYAPAARVRHEVSAATAVAWGDARRRRALAATYGWIARRRGAWRAAAVGLLHLAGSAGRAAAGAAPGRRYHAAWAIDHARALGALLRR